MKLKEEKARNSVETSVKANDLRAKLKELKDLVLVNVDGFNAKGDKPTSLLSQTNWDMSDRSVPWDVINGVVEVDALAIAAAAANAANVAGDDDKTSDEASQSNDAIFRTQAAEAKTLGDYKEAVRQSQEGRQPADS
jgi:hypothetical protein